MNQKKYSKAMMLLASLTLTITSLGLLIPILKAWITTGQISANSSPYLVISIIGTLFFGSVFILMLLDTKRIPPQSTQKHAELDKAIDDLWWQDINAFKLVRRNPKAFLWPFITPLIAPILGFIIGVITSIYLDWAASFFIGLLITVMVYFLGFVIAGETLQRQVMQADRSFKKDLLADYIRTLPLMMLMTLLLALLLLSKDNNNSSHTEILSESNISFWSIFSGAGLIVLKYYIYINFCSVIFENSNDKRLSYKETAEIMVNHKLTWFKISVSAGLIFGLPFLLFGGLYSIFGHGSLLFISGLSLVLWFLIGAASEQVHVLVNYLRLRHPETQEKLNKLLSETSNINQ